MKNLWEKSQLHASEILSKVEFAKKSLDAFAQDAKLIKDLPIDEMRGISTRLAKIDREEARSISYVYTSYLGLASKLRQIDNLLNQSNEDNMDGLKQGTVELFGKKITVFLSEEGEKLMRKCIAEDTCGLENLQIKQEDKNGK